MRQMMTTRIAALRSALRAGDAEGQGLAEYALILGMIAVVCVGALGLLGEAIATSPGFGIF